mmetsp:Transcript_26938/g.40774  ORF Transcript_26938/g.40774 Transcript_26938/m.40774 type:complete len:242 (+) Transcript_26938:79-804(+)
MSKKHQKESFVASMRRTAAVRNKHSTLPEEMQPMLKREDEKGRANRARSSLLEDDIKICVRDHRDAAGKRAYRVQVPKRMICYTCLIFVLLPVFLFGYVETHRSSLKNARSRTSKKKHKSQNATIIEEIEEVIEDATELAENLAEEIVADIVGPAKTQMREDDENATESLIEFSKTEMTGNITATTSSTTELSPSIMQTISTETKKDVIEENDEIGKKEEIEKNDKIDDARKDSEQRLRRG